MRKYIRFESVVFDVKGEPHQEATVALQFVKLTRDDTGRVVGTPHRVEITPDSDIDAMIAGMHNHPANAGFEAVPPGEIENLRGLLDRHFTADIVEAHRVEIERIRREDAERRAAEDEAKSAPDPLIATQERRARESAERA